MEGAVIIVLFAGMVRRVTSRQSGLCPDLDPMSLNKKQKKQLDVEHKKVRQLEQQLAGARQQLDDPAEVARLEKEIAAANLRIAKLKEE